MAKFLLDFGQTWDMLTRDELREELAQDARNRATLAGVKLVEQFHGVSATGGNATIYTTPAGPPYSPAAGFVWAIMNIGIELALASQVRIYKGVPPYTAAAIAPTGAGRFVNSAGNAIATSVQMSKGQLTMRAGDQLTFIASTASAFILSVFIAGIEVPAERIGELLL